MLSYLLWTCGCELVILDQFDVLVSWSLGLGQLVISVEFVMKMMKSCEFVNCDENDEVLCVCEL
jgi:hypothetical protein